MCECACVCVCVCVFFCLCVYVCMFMCVCVYVYVCVLCLCVCVRARGILCLYSILLRGVTQTFDKLCSNQCELNPQSSDSLKNLFGYSVAHR